MSAEKEEEALTGNSQARYFEGKLHNQPVTAYLILMNLSGNVNYLITLACKTAYPDLDLKELARTTVEKILG